MFHRAATELPWGDPNVLKKLTIAQLLATVCERPPGGGPSLTSVEEYEAAVAAGQRE